MLATAGTAALPTHRSSAHEADEDWEDEDYGDEEAEMDGEGGWADDEPGLGLGDDDQPFEAADDFDSDEPELADEDKEEGEKQAEQQVAAAGAKLDDSSEEDDDVRDATDEGEQEAPDELQELAKRINEAHLDCVGLNIMTNDRAVEAGKLLREAKRCVGYNAWQQWLDANVDVSTRQAQRYMRLAKHVPRLDKLNPCWKREWTLSRALHELKKARRANAVKDAEEDSDGAGQEVEEPAAMDELADAPSDDAPGGEQSGKAKAAAPRAVRPPSRQSIQRASTFENAELLTFKRKSQESEALDRLDALLLRAARKEAKKLLTEEIADAGYDAETVALVLLKRQFEAGGVSKLFRAK